MPHLALPDSRFKDSFLQALKEYQVEGLANYVDLDEAVLQVDFDGYVQKLRDEAVGENLPDGYVPHTLFWLVDGDEYLGRVDIRHTLNEFLKKEGGHIGYDIRPSQRRKGYGTLALKLGLEKAYDLGVKKVLVTCDVTNVGSNKIIVENGGVFEDELPLGDGKVGKNRYWIAVKE
jgi:predicted acetyltransferase